MTNAVLGEEIPRDTPSTVFVSDPSAEAERIAHALRGAGYGVVDVPLSMLIARVAVQRPRIILVDADAEGALPAVARLRDLPDAEGIDVVFVGRLGEALLDHEDALAHEGSGFFARPVDVPALLRKIEALTGLPVQKDPALRPSTPPQPSARAILLPPASMRAGVGSDPPKRVSERPGPMARSQPPSLPDLTQPPPVSLDPEGRDLSMLSMRRPDGTRRLLGLQTPLSDELETLLAEAEQRIGVQMREDTVLPTPEEEIEAVLPAEILSALDEPLDEEDEDDFDIGRGGPHDTRLPVSLSSRGGPAGDASKPPISLLSEMPKPVPTQGEASRLEETTRHPSQAAEIAKPLVPSPSPNDQAKDLKVPAFEDAHKPSSPAIDGLSPVAYSADGRKLMGLPADAPRGQEAGEGGDVAPGKTQGGPQGATTGTRAGSGIIENREGSGSLRESAPVGTAPSTRGLVSHERDAVVVSSGTSGAPPTEHFASYAMSGPQPMSTQPPTGPPLANATLGSGSLELLADRLHEAAAAAFPLLPLPGAPPTGSQGRSTKAESVPPPAPNAPSLPPIPSVLGSNDALVVLARAIAVRATGALCIESEDGVRRVVLREGDLVTAASGVEGESLLAFLGGRGELPREIVHQLTGKVPPFGRHAGAALVAHGHLRQDQLWPVLRGHAEWILGRLVLVPRGTALIEQEPPGRLKTEPSVFGGSTGAEVLIEVVRRVIAPDEAIARLGGSASRLAEGPNHSLLSECALDAAARDLLTRMPGAAIGEFVQAAAGPDFASVIYGLSLLGVVDIIRSVAAVRGPAGDTDGRATFDPLDEDAVRARVRARLALVDEADYFAVLGVTVDATGYEVRRAFLELRRAFDPQRVLTPQIADLADDVRKIVVVLEEAYEILRDNARRERYRRAIGASPDT